MALEFRCQACGQLMSVGDEFAGRQAQCPGCHNFILVPMTTQPMVRQSEWARPIPSTAENSFGEPSQNPYAAQQVADPSYLPAGILDPADVLKTSWEIFKNRWRDILLATIIFIAIQQFISTVIQFVLINVGILQLPEKITPDNFTPTMLGMAIYFVIVTIATSWLTPGYIQLVLKVCRGEPTKLAELFQGGSYYYRFLSVNLVTTLLMLSGIPLLMLPTIYFAIIFLPASYIVVDQNKGLLDTLQTSARITRPNLINILLTVIALAVSLLLVFTIFLIPVALTVMYLRMSGQAVSDGIIREQPISNP